MANQWNTFAHLPSLSNGFAAGTMLLLSDGSVLVHNENTVNGIYVGKEWFRLTPDKNGKYETGSWAGPFSMATQRQFFASGILMDGRVFVLGGEYTTATTPTDSNLGEIFDPQTNSWSAMTTPFSWANGDCSACILADGRVLFGSLSTTRTAIWDPVTDVWIEAGLGFGAMTFSSKSNSSDEETWTLLPDGSVLTVEISSTPLTQKYVPSLDLWMPADQTPATLTTQLPLISLNDTDLNPPVSVNIGEIGPAIYLPASQKVLAVGATGHTALYTPPASASQPGSWAAGPDMPADTSGKQFNSVNGNIQTAIDAPGVLLPGGKVLLAIGNTRTEGSQSANNLGFWSNPTNIVWYDPTTNATPTLLDQQPPNNGSDTWTARFLLLPTGQVLFTAQQNMIAILTVDTNLLGAPSPSWAPVITSFPDTMVTGHSYTLAGTQFNGLSQACSYGDDAQMATNYPIVRVTNTGNQQITYLRSVNFSSFSIAVGNPGSTDIFIPSDMAAGAYTLQVIANGIPSASVNIQIVTRDCFIVVDRSTFGQGEIQATINANGAPAVFVDALYVVVEGCKPSDLGLTPGNLSAPGIKPTIPNPTTNVSFVFAGPVIPEDPSLPNSPQRFTYPYNASFTDSTSMFGFTGSTEQLTVTATLPVGGDNLTNSADIELTKNPNPFISHGDSANTWYLSVDIKVFQLKAGDTLFSQPLTATGTASAVATSWIQQVITACNSDRSSANSIFDSLPGDDEDAAAIALSPVDSNGTAVYNFALARVRYRDTIPADNVRLFFRMWQAQQTNASYGNPTTLYRSFLNSSGGVIPLLGVQGDEIMTIPFFATPRVDSTTASMTTQTDSPNVQAVISPSALGGEVDSFFGAWLDINQPDDLRFPDVLVGGPNLPDGPFVNTTQLVSIQQLVRSEHQCLLAEISFDPDPIPANADPSTSDKLAQRNLAFVDVPNPGKIASRRAPQLFEIRPSPSVLLPGIKADELMIDWGNIPAGSTAQIYLPGVAAAEVLDLASQLYSTHRLSTFDAHTITCPAGGLGFIPIPQGAASYFTGLLTIDLPEGITKGEVYSVVVKQVTGALGYNYRSKGYNNIDEVGNDNDRYATTIAWRRVLGVFKLTITVSTRQALLETEESRLSIMRWIGKSISRSDRWYAVFHRYLEQLAGRVQFMGGDPAIIAANSSGIWRTPVLPDENGDDEKHSFTGKVSGVLYDQFGDFEGFLLHTGEEERRFEAWEQEIGNLVREAWAARMIITVITCRHHEHRPERIILRRLPL